MIICLLITVAVGWLGMRYINSQRERQLLADLDRRPYSGYFTGVPADDEIFERYSLDKLFRIAERYSTAAAGEPSDSAAARIAAGALIHFGSRYDVKSKMFMRDPRAAKIAERFFDSKIEPLAAASTMILMGHHRLANHVGSSSALIAVIEDGYDSDNPLDVYVLVGEIYEVFQHGDAESSIEENWPTPRHPWDCYTFEPTQPPSHTYQDKIDALRQVSPDAADAYAAMVEVFRKCDAKPSDQQRLTLSGLSNDMMNALDAITIFRFMLRNPEVFKSEPSLCLPVPVSN